ncbi:MAG: phosphatase PAP2 family protein [Ginsengibacter sp.]
MAVNRFYTIFLFLLFAFYSHYLTAQDTGSNSVKISSNSFEDSATQMAQQVKNDHYLKPTALLIPGTFLIYGGLKPAIHDISKLDNQIMNHIQKNYPDFDTDVADYLMWVPSASVYVMDAFQIKTTHNFKDHLFLDAGSILITGALGFGMRKITENIEAYNSDNTRFPSGHTANAFRGAEIIHQELKFSRPVLSYSGYLMATGVGLLRMYNKQHFLTEIVAGAGLGILSTKLTYWIFDKIKLTNNRKSNQIF